jgi:hypothetical protein
MTSDDLLPVFRDEEICISRDDPTAVVVLPQNRQGIAGADEQDRKHSTMRNRTRLYVVCVSGVGGEKPRRLPSTNRFVFLLNS